MFLRIASLIILFLKLEDVASDVTCTYYPLYPEHNLSMNTNCFSHCCNVSFPTARECACCGEWKITLAIPFGLVFGFLFAVSIVFLIFCLINKCKKTKTQKSSSTNETTDTIITRIQRAPVISYSTARNVTSLETSQTQEPYPYPFPSVDFDSYFKSEITYTDSLEGCPSPPDPYPYLPYVLPKPLPYLFNLPTSATINAQKKDDDPPNYVSTMKTDLQKEP